MPPETPASDAHPARPRAGQLFQRLALVAFLLSAAAWLASIFTIAGFANAVWPQVIFLLFALAVTLTDLAQSLPLQNVATIAAFTIVVSAIVGIAGVHTNIPFGPRIFTGDLGPEIFGLPVVLPVIWTVTILNSRGVAKLILNPWRKLSNYGLRVIALTCLLTLLFDLSLEPFAASVNSWWIWQLPGQIHEWPGAPLINLAAWGLLALVILVLVTPWLINKQPGQQPPASYQPLIVWLLLNLLPAADTVTHHLWLPPAFTLICTTVVAILVVRGARSL